MKINSNRLQSVSLYIAEVEPGFSLARNRACPPRNMHAQKVAPAINHMLEHVNQPLRIATLSGLLGVSVSQFFLLFKAATGLTPMNYFIRLRMQRACELLQDHTSSIKETAYLLGYKDPFYFSRLFKSVTGIAPREYRKRVRRPQLGRPGYPPALKRRLSPQALYPEETSISELAIPTPPLR